MVAPVVSRVFEFSGGMNSRSAVTKTPETEARLLQNVEIDQDGAALVRLGYEPLSVPDTDNPVGTGIFRYEPDTGTAEIIKTCRNVAGTDMRFKRFVSATGTWTDITESGFTFANHTACQGVMANQFLYVAARGGTNRVMRYNGTNVVEIATSPVCQGLAYFKRRLFAWGDTSAPHTIYFTATGSLENWTTSDSGSITIAVGDGDEIVSAKPLYDRMPVMKTNSFYVIEGNDYSTFRLIEVFPQDAGCVAAGSVLQIENLIYYMGRNKVYVTDGTSVTSISDGIQPTLDDRNKTYDSSIFAIHNRARNGYMLFYASGAAVDISAALVYKYKSGLGSSAVNGNSGWVSFSNFPMQAAVSFTANSSTGVPEDFIYMIGINSLLYSFEKNDAGTEVTTDHGVAVSYDLRSRWDDAGDIVASKRLRRLIFVFATDESAGLYATIRYVNIGVPAYRAYQFRLSGTGTASPTLRMYTDYDESTVRQTRTIVAPSGVTLIGLNKVIAQMQITTERGQEAN